MSGSKNIYSYEWCELVFEDKNKEYGAYNLRLSSSKRHLIALISSILFFTLAILSPIIIKNVMPEEKERITDVTTLSDLKMEKAKPKDDVNKIQEQAPPPELKSSIKFTPPVVKPDDEIVEDMKSQEELTKTDVAISIADVKGNDEGGVDIATLNTNQAISNDVEEAIQDLASVEQQPEFPGGTEELFNYLRKNIVYPPQAREMNITGKVFIEFVVEANGSITNVDVKRSIGGGCDEEALRVVKAMPRWMSGKQNGKSVRCRFVLPINFKLN